MLRYFHRHGLLERHVTDDMLTWQASGGFSIDASVHIAARDRAGLERLALLIHPPRIHRHRYHGVLAPNARLRYQVIALGQQGRVEESSSGQLGTQSVAGSSGGAPGRRASSRWAALIDLPTRPPPLSPARAPPRGIFEFDQTGGFDPTDPELIPEFEFDQSLPD